MNIESVLRIEPARLEEPTAEIADTIAELSAATATLGKALHPLTASSLADLVRIMNTYYSNLIEGHDTRPRDIEKAMAGQFSDESSRRNLQLEAAAHVRVQREIDRQALQGELSNPTGIDFIKWLHREFYRDAPKDLLMIRSDSRSFLMEPGIWRNRPEHDVAVGRHIPPSSPRIDDFMNHFQERFKMAKLGKAAQIMAIASAHHRLNYIHPFPDGNGRVSRLMSHAMAQVAGIGAHGLWSVSRGLARGLSNRDEYKRMMDQADTQRISDMDGRGNLSEKALKDFVLWFLKICLDQVAFMKTLFDLDELSGHFKNYVERHANLKPESFELLDETLIRGALDRGDVSRVTGLPERSARRILSDLIRTGFLASETPKGKLTLRFPIHAAEDLFPKLFPVV